MLLKDLTAEGIHAAGSAIGVTPRLARRLQALAVKKRCTTLPPALEGVARKTWDGVRALAVIPHLTLVEKATSPFDGFSKYLFRGDGPEVFEAVRIPLMHKPGDEKYVICVSSQVGCAAKCAFCATGKMGMRRNLATWEMVDQVIKIQSDSAYPVRGVVFMGMGEPLLNYSRVMRAAAILSDPSGSAIDAKSITISTVGVAPMIRRFTQEGRPYRLIFSMSTAFDAQRDELLPMNKVHPLDEVLAALRAHQAANGKRLLLAWTMMAGVNMSREHMRELARRTSGLRILLDLIPVNDPSGKFRPPTDDELNSFLDIIRAEVACPIVRRYTGGKDIHGACGMLAGRTAAQLAAPVATEQ